MCLDLFCGLCEFFWEIFELVDFLEVFNFSGNVLDSLLDDFGWLYCFKVLFCFVNDFDELLVVVGDCLVLSMVGFKFNCIEWVLVVVLLLVLCWLIFIDNWIVMLFEELGCWLLQKLMLVGNCLEVLFESMVVCEGLELLWIVVNCFQCLLVWLVMLLCLVWLVYVGNLLCCLLVLVDSGIVVLDWSELSLDGLIGEGVFGVIYCVGWYQLDGLMCMVVLKLFKGEVISDGIFVSEMVVCLVVGCYV